MGTRNLTAVMANNEYKIAQYGQWDGYPSGQGITILRFLREYGNVKKLSDALERVRFLEADGKDKIFLEEYESNVEKNQRTAEQKKWFDTYISRDIGGSILQELANTEDKEVILKNSIGFAGDSLFCEYAYIIDLDAGVLEIYEGFNRTPITEGRFISNDPKLERSNNPDGYEPVKLVRFYPLSDLPTEEEFLKDLEPGDAE